MPAITYDAASGRLVGDRVWQMVSWEFDRRNFSAGYAYLRYYDGEVDKIHGCPNCPNHVTAEVWRRLEVELFGAAKLVSLDLEWDVVSNDFAALLERSGLTGVIVGDEVGIFENQCGVEDPKLRLLLVTGDGGSNHRYKVKDGPNECPYCCSEPLVCPACSNLLQKCSIHGKVIRPELTESNLGQWLFYYKVAPKQYVVDGRTWDRADFFKIRGTGDALFVSERARKWLTDVGATGFDVKPALLDVEGVESRFGVT
jgi:hypothetical protein